VYYAFEFISFCTYIEEYSIAHRGNGFSSVFLLCTIVWPVYVFIIDFGSCPIWSGSLFLDFIFMTMAALLTFS